MEVMGFFMPSFNRNPLIKSQAVPTHNPPEEHPAIFELIELLARHGIRGRLSYREGIGSLDRHYTEITVRFKIYKEAK